MCYSIEVPPEECLSGGPGPISLPQLLSGDGVFTVGVRLPVGAENPVYLVEEVPEHLAPLPWTSLDDRNEFVQVDIEVFRGGGLLLRWEVFPVVVSLGLRCA